VKKKYPFLRIDDLFYQLKDANIFSMIDLRLGYHKVIIKEEEINKTTLRKKVLREHQLYAKLSKC
jgi:hypothetical protein